MPHLIYSRNAVKDFNRLCDFLRKKDLRAAQRAASAIYAGIEKILIEPRIGRPIKNMPHQYREWLIKFGASGYVAKYYFDEADDKVTVIAVKHQKENDYR